MIMLRFMIMHSLIMIGGFSFMLHICPYYCVEYIDLHVKILVFGLSVMDEN